MEFAFPDVWYCRSYASEGERVGELERTKRTLECFESVEVGSIVFNVVYLETAERKKL
jgi:hypothetical protein